ncbi:MAG: hypothetical protein OHK0031_19680 [Anaerolineales bacterium]
MFKKILLIVSVLVVTLLIFGAGFAFAQYQNVSAAGYGPGGMMGGRGGYEPGTMMGGRGGYGPIHDYVEQALGEKLGLTEAQVEEQLSAGKTMAQIATDNGIADADLSAFLTDVHTAAFDKAVAAGVLTREQADLMLQNMSANGFDPANCPMNGVRPQDGSGYRGGRGHGNMMGGWGQQPAVTPAP